MEADITINGQKLTEAQAMTLRVAITGWLIELEDPHALGSDDHGKAMVKAYRQRCSEIQELIFRNLTAPPVAPTI